LTRFARVGGPVFAGSSADGAVNAGYVVTGLGALAVDTLVTRADGVALLKAAETEGGRVTAICFTHEHADHTIGSTDFPPGGVIVSEGTARGLAEERVWLAEAMAGEGVKPKDPTLVFESGIRLPWGPEIIIRELGGHARGSTVVFVPSAGVLFAGDLVFRGRPAYIGGMTAEKWLAALRTLEGWNVKTVVPGHGPVGGPEALTEQRVWLERFVNRARELKSRGLGLAEATETLAGEFGFTDRRVEGLRMGLENRLGFTNRE